MLGVAEAGFLGEDIVAVRYEVRRLIDTVIYARFGRAMMLDPCDLECRQAWLLAG